MSDEPEFAWAEPEGADKRQVVLMEQPLTSVDLLLPILASMATSPREKARRRAEHRAWIAEQEAKARAYRTEHPQGRAAKRRLRQRAGATP